MLGPCAKARVKCTLVNESGARFTGTNYCLTAQPQCPRQPGEGYEKCASVCNTAGHAETVALQVAGVNAKGTRAYITGHTYACRECQEALFAAGVISISVGAPPP